MLLHAPIFMHWVEDCVQSHVPEGCACQNRSGADNIDDDDKRCKVCLLHALVTTFWDHGGKNQVNVDNVLDDFWNRISEDWFLSSGMSEDEIDDQQDIAGFLTELLRQLKEDCDGTCRASLNGLFMIQTTNMEKCTGDGGCTKRSCHDDEGYFLHARFADGNPAVTMEETIRKSLHECVTDDVCTECHHHRSRTLQLRHPPELLLVHLNRINPGEDESGGYRPNKITTEIDFPEELRLDADWFDPRWGAGKRSVAYELFSVLLHHGQWTNSGHYTVAVKGKDGNWVLADDTALTRFDSFNAVKDAPGLRRHAYIFAYRRLPLVQHTATDIPKPEPAPANKARASEAEKGGDDEEESEEGGRGADDHGGQNMDYDETEIELEEKQRGQLEITFTTNTGVVTLRAHVKGILWNDLSLDPARTGTTAKKTPTKRPAISGELPSKPTKKRKRPAPKEPGARKSARQARASTTGGGVGRRKK
ncbi:uncharacterized protein N7482_004683 [Penicillium canariense]|uniref:USP domain-containing protein n=1 Tax=Penicillium canariense TaxID=189055 RepID=A0A9W9LPL7_9EURO|nr:uncharacterized protein N7482_004683 [Penicillium canariense]KAJ5169089.1 hypothetical protein N7482_004683 [Penicillium canariense]